MKVIDLLNNINNFEDMPKEIEVDGYHFKYDNIEKFYQTEDKRDLLEIGKDYSTYEFLNFYVEILNNEIIQNKPDEIEELEKLETYEVDNYDTVLNRNKINELIRKVNEINRKLEEK